MGSHTWIYEKVKNVPSDEVMFKYFMKVTFEDKYGKTGYWDLDYDLSNEWGVDCIRVFDIDYSKIPEEIRHLASKEEDEFSEVVKANFSLVFDEKGTYKETRYHDIFRISGYPENVWLHSYEECEKFINSKNVVTELPEGYDPDNAKLADRLYCLDKSKEETLDICKKFYKEHPDTLIKFG